MMPRVTLSKKIAGIECSEITLANYDLAFPSLPDFKSALLVLSYFHFDDDVRYLLGHLCRLTRIFAMRHKAFLQNLMVKWAPPPSKSLFTLDFGFQDKTWNHQTYPHRHIREYGRKGTKMSGISFLCRYDRHPLRIDNYPIARSLRGACLRFSDGATTAPLPQVEDGFKKRDKEIKIEIDPEKEISNISLGMSFFDSIVGLRVYGRVADKVGELFVDENWLEKSGHNPAVE